MNVIKVLVLIIVFIPISFLRNPYKENSFDLIEEPGTFPILHKKNKCEKSFFEILRNNIRDPRFKNVLLYSGFKINDIGDYRRCESGNLTHYFSLYDLNSNRIGIGICMPKECNSQHLSNFISKFAIPVLKILKPNNSFSFQVQEPYFDKSNYRKEQKNFGYYFGIVILLLVAFIVLTFSFYQFYFKTVLMNRNNKNKTPLPNFYKWINCVSIINNTKSLLRCENRFDPNLESLNVLRIICMFWIVSGHCLAFYELNFPLNLLSVSDHIKKSDFYVILRNATPSVDVFFFLSGFLSTLSFAIYFDKKENRKISTILLSYLHRYIRLIPMIFVIWMIAVYYLPFCQDGPFAYPFEISANICRINIAPMFLLLSNYFQTYHELCNLWLWYLYIDWQLFLITPFLILIYIKSHKIGLFLMGILAFCSFVYQFVFFQFINKSDPSFNDINFKNDYYMQPYCRCNTYFIGIIFCILYLSSEKRKLLSFQSGSLDYFNKLFNKRNIRYLMYILGIVLAVFFIFAENIFDHSSTKLPQIYCTIFLLFYRIGFTFGVALLIYPAILGYNRPLKSIFSHPIFNILGKLTYGCYLIHVLLFQTFLAKTLNNRYFNFWVYIMDIIFGFGFSYFLSFLAGLLFEIPIAQIEKTLLTEIMSSRGGAQGTNGTKERKSETINNIENTNDKNNNMT